MRVFAINIKHDCPHQASLEKWKLNLHVHYHAFKGLMSNFHLSLIYRRKVVVSLALSSPSSDTPYEYK